MKFGIISSVSESCGNAAFTQVLLDSINATGNTAIGVALNLDLTQSSDPELIKIADRHINEIAKTLDSFDAINIQYEPGLYGPSSKLIFNRLKTLINANSNVVITIHSMRLFTARKEPLLRQTLKYVARFQLRSAIHYYAHVTNTRNVAKQNRRCLDLFIKNNAKIIVHTQKSKLLIQKYWNYDSIYVHPLKFIDPSAVNSHRSHWLERLNLSESDTLVGVFGYISKYKGHDVALDALNELPTNYKLVFAGRQHPQTVKEYEEIDSYLKFLLQKIQLMSRKVKTPLSGRVIFLNELTDEELVDLAGSVDFAWLPYQEVGQDGSGIASILFDAAPRVIASNAKSFDELIILEPSYKSERFDIGNYLELASKTLRYREFRTPNASNYTLKSQAELYLELLTKK